MPASSMASSVRITSRGSTSKRSGLCAAFVMRYTRSERPLRPASRPQHSSGASARACATISSMCSGANSTPPRLQAGLGLDRLPVGAILVAVVAAQRLLELAHPVADRAPDLGQLLRAEHDQSDREYDNEFKGPDLKTAHGMLAS